MPVTLELLSKQWLETTNDFRPSAFWFWNSAMDPDEMAGAVAEMAANGIREFIIHPIQGLEIEYLSDEYLDRLRLALGLAREHGLKVWIYDEYGWPSGVAGGRVIREHPEFRNRYLAFTRDADGRVAAAPRMSGAVTDNVMGAPWTLSEAGYLDTLDVNAVRCFIENTHERIHAACAEFFGDVIAGFFTDEPCTMVDGQDGEPFNWTFVAMPWTPALPALFHERFGYEIEPLYAELAGDGPSQVKRDYWSLVKDLHCEAYHGQLARWCAEHGVKYTGHVGEDRLVMQVRFTGSIFRSLGYMDVPGIDFLGPGDDPEGRFIEQVTVHSVARHTGRDRVYCEAYGITPFDIRLGSMLRRAQMLGIHGINDIALMGFHQSLDGIRKRTYWPPIFHTAPWWPFYPEFRDAFARSVGLVSLGKARARYAILYPQNQLEQTDVFLRDFWFGPEPASAAVERLGLAAYAAGETFEFVFPEMIAQAAAENGRISFPHAHYDAILAPSDLAYFDADNAALDALQRGGGRVMRMPLDEMEAYIRATPPSWSRWADINADGSPGDVRVYEFEFPDGRLFALRNVTDSPRDVSISSPNSISEWNPLDGGVTSRGNAMQFTIDPRTCRYITISTKPFGPAAPAATQSRVPIDAEWSVTPEQPNTARLSRVQFHHPQLGWLDAVEPLVPASPGSPPRTGLPIEFAGQDCIEFRAQFDVMCPPESLGLVFEAGHVESLSVNGAALDLASAVPTPARDLSCRRSDATAASRTGVNEVRGVIAFKPFETRVVSSGHFHYHPMPMLDICLSGHFRLVNGKIARDEGASFRLPLDLSGAGWEQYSGIVRIRARVEVSEPLAGSIHGIEVEPVAEDCVELLIDGRSVGRRIVRPYVFTLDSFKPGAHDIELRISSTSGNILHVPARWGIDSAHWICA